MKLSVADLFSLPWNVRQALTDLITQIQAGWNVQHDGEGGHTDITATSVSMGGFLVPASAVTSPPQITGNVNDYAIPNFNTSLIVKLTTDASRNITGLLAPTDRTSYRRWQFRNTGGFDYVLIHASASSVPTNRFANPGAVNVTVNPGDSIWVEYDPALSRFVPEGL